MVCGLLQRFQRLGVEEKGHDADEGDAVAVGSGLFVWIAGHNDFPEVVADVTERESLLFACFDKLVQKDVSLNGHSDSPTLKLRASARKFKTEVVYQFAGFRSSEALNFCASARKFKAKEAA